MRTPTAIRSGILLLLLTLTVFAAGGARAEVDESRVFVTPMIGYISLDANDLWNSIDPTAIYGGRVGVRVNRWVAVDAGLGYAFANGNFSIGEDGDGDFFISDNAGEDLDVLYLGVDLSFHPMQGNLDPWLAVGWTLLNYDFEFNSAGFKDWLGDRGYDTDLADLKTASGWEFAIGTGYAFRTTEHQRWSAVVELRDLWVRSARFGITGPDGQTIMEPEYGHNLIFNLGVEFAWGGYGGGDDDK